MLRVESLLRRRRIHVVLDNAFKTFDRQACFMAHGVLYAHSIRTDGPS